MKFRSLFAVSLPLLAVAALCCPASAVRAADDKESAPASASQKSDSLKKDEATNALPQKEDAAKAVAADKTEGAKGASSDKKEPKDELSETTNSVTINSVPVKYNATAGTLVMKDEEGKAHVSFFFVAYTRLDATNAGERPVTFTFNGGPGSSSVWLHLGVLGPRRVLLKEDGSLPPPPFRLIDNQYSLLDESDLVFIDPVSTGFTRAVPVGDASKYHGVDQDLQSVGDFIRLYTTRYQRWNSPKFLIGESYGTTRAAGLSGYLESRFGMYLNGIALVSSILDFSTISFNPGNDLPFIMYLPTETAVAWFHKKLPPDLQADRSKALLESEKYALGDYSRALMQGSAISAPDRQRVVREVARLTGLSEDYVDRADLRIQAHRYFKELLRKERLIIGRYDGRLTGSDLDAVGDSPEFDPSFTSVLGPFTATLNDYVRRELKFESDLPYEVLTGKVQPWDYNDARNHYLDVAETLRQTMTHNPYLKVFVANGYFDMATPYLATRYTFDHMGLPPALQANVSMGYYEAGHMMYVNQPSLVALKRDLATFIRSALPPK
ncbi:MAG: peptidase S10 [Verrucomicrobiota bacterium]|jgi:carboxypeptidase C (cathepsin A)